MYKAIFFDVGGVLVGGDIKRLYETLAKRLGIDPEELIELYEKDKLNLVTGKHAMASFFKEAETRFEVRAQQASSLKENLLRKLPLNRELLNLTSELKKQYTLGIVSNATDDFRKICGERSVYEDFDPVIISCEVGFAKPDKRIFEVALKKAQLTPEQCIYIDDQKKLLKTPKQMGFATIHYKNNWQLVRELEKYQVEIRALITKSIYK